MNTDLKLCLASPVFYPTYGGSQLRYLRYLPGFNTRGLETHVVTATPTRSDVTAKQYAHAWDQYAVGQMLPVEYLNGTPVHRIKLPDTKNWQRPFLFNRKLVSYCRDPATRPDVLQIVGTLRAASIPWLWQLRRLGIPVIYAVTITSKLKSSKNTLSFKQRRYRWVFNTVDCIIANNTLSRTFLRDMGVNTRIEVFPNGVDLRRFRRVEDQGRRNKLRASLSVKDGELVITTVGAVTPRKGSHLLLEAWVRLAKRFPDTRLIFVGPRKDLENPELQRFKEQLQALLRECGAAQRVHFIGVTEQVEDYLQASDIFVLASEREGMPNAVLEAMACGVPVVMTPFVGLTDELGVAGTHFILAQREVDALASALEALIVNQDQRSLLASQARQWAVEKMNVDDALDRYAALYRELAKKN